LISAVGTASTSTTTGAIVITNSGGLGVAGTVNAGEYRSTNGYFWANGAVYAPPVVPTGSEYSFQYKIGANFIGANNLKYWPVTSNIIISGGSVSTSANTGVLVVRGGIGVDGNLNISQGADGNAVVAQGRVYGSNVTVNTGVFWSNGTVFSGRGIPGNTEGAIQYNNGDTFAGSEFLRFDATNANVVIGSGTTSANITSGALVVVGGVGVSGTINTDNILSNQGFFWSNGSVYSGEGVPRGADYEIQFKTGTTFSGATGFKVIGGEGNGGIIYPESHYGRDAMVGIALFLTHLAKSNKLCSILRNSYPDYFIAKKKIELTPDINLDGLMQKVQDKYSKHPINTVDGVKIEFDKEWVHLRKSNTEPIIRIYAESQSEATANHLAEKLIMDMKQFIK
jgi:hypothetical protein